MASLEEHLKKVREDRIAREKTRIEKLREMNLKKYGNVNALPNAKNFVSNIPIGNRLSKNAMGTRNNVSNSVKYINHLQPTTSVKPDKDKPSTSKNVSKLCTNVKAKGDAKSCTNNDQVANVNTARDKTVALGKEKVTITNKSCTNNDQVANVITARDKTVAIGKKKVTITNKSCTNNDQVANVNTARDKTVAIGKEKVTITNNNNPKILRNSVAFPSSSSNKTNYTESKNVINPNKTNSKLPRQSIAVSLQPKIQVVQEKPTQSRKSMIPSKLPQSSGNLKPNEESVFDRLYKPKLPPKKLEDPKIDANDLRKVIKDSGNVRDKRLTVFEHNKEKSEPVRRSISAVHFKRISKSELTNCIHKCSSIGDRIDKAHLEINEDNSVKEDKIVSAIKSERKRVMLRTPVSFNFNTPKPEELQVRLNNWLQKRGKSIESYHHLQCFGLHHLPQKELQPLPEIPMFKLHDDENKENIAVESDSDNESYTENMNEENVKTEWERRSYGRPSESIDMNETCESMISSEGMQHHADEVLLGALNDLTQLLKEGYDWEQGSRWLRAVRERFPTASDSAAYWECRAVLEERRGDLPASVQCWEEAIAKGTERSVVEANLDQLLDKFMQLKISPNSGKRKINDKMVDVKNVFKSTIIRFAVQQAKMRQSSQHEARTPKYTVTPVRRSSRLSVHCSARRTPLQVVSSFKQASLFGDTMFVPNDKLYATP